MKIAYLGPKGTFTEKVAKRIYPQAQLIHIQAIRNLILSVENNKIDLAVVPLENFYNGEVRETFDVLTECKHSKIIAETSEKIELCLGALKESTTIKKIISKDQAIEQSSKYLAKYYPKAITLNSESTANAIQIIKEKNLLEFAAIASESALKNNHFKIIAKDICPENKTRFAIIGKRISKKTGDDKTFIALHPEIDKPGVLSNALGFLAGFGINLEYIQSRPDKKNGYYFYIELNGHIQDIAIKKALDSIKFSLDPKNKFPKTIQFLGSYKNTHWKN